MENQECNKNTNIRHMYSDFMVKIAKFDELVNQGSKLILDFQQALEFLCRPRFEKTSALVDDIIKSNETKRLSSYLKAGGFQVHDVTENLSRLNLSRCGLTDCLIKGKHIVDELECFLNNATEVKAATENLYSNNKMSSEEMRIYDQNCDAAAVMAILCSMVKQDFRMQEQIVLSLSLKSSSGELERYSLMWSLRPFIDEEFMLSAWKLVP